MRPPNSIDNLNDRFAIPAIAKIVIGNGNLPKVQISSPAASADIYLHGAQITSWKPAGGAEVIFLSEHSRFEDGKAIRGGIPICFPWFRAKADDPKAPAHGFVRTRAWQLESIVQVGDSVVVSMAMENDEYGRRWWPHEFRIVHRITVGAELKLELIVSNTGSSHFQFEEALHTYHRVGDVEKLCIGGLDSAAFLDNRDQNRKRIQIGDVQFTGQTDNAYLHSETALEIADPVLRRRIQIEKYNSATTIVWNPWQDGAETLADLGSNEWRQFACVEASNILASTIHLDPGEHHTMSATVRALPSEG